MSAIEEEVLEWLLTKLRYNATSNPDGIQDPLGGTSRTWIIATGARNANGYPRISLKAFEEIISSPYICARGEGNTYVKKHEITYQLEIYVKAGQDAVSYLGKSASDGKLIAILSDEVLRVLNENEAGAKEIDDDDYIDIHWIGDIRRRSMDELDISESAKSENIPPRFRKVIDFDVIAFERRDISD